MQDQNSTQDMENTSIDLTFYYEQHELDTI
jgi:hypothetical protein